MKEDFYLGQNELLTRRRDTHAYKTSGRGTFSSRGNTKTGSLNLKLKTPSSAGRMWYLVF